MSGHIEKRVMKDGSVKYKIVVEVSVDPVTGKRNRLYETVNGTKKQAESRLRQILTEMEGQTYINKSNQTLGEWLDEWMTVYISHTHSPNTLRGYKCIINNYIKIKLGNIKLQDLSTTQLQKFYNEIRESSPVTNRPISAKTVKNVHMIIQAALNKALELDLIKKNPDHHIQIAKPKKYVAEVYDADEIQQLIEYSKGTDMELAIHMLLCFGVRRSELVGLKFSDIDWDNAKLSISRALAMKDGKVIEKQPKTESSNRKIDIPKYLLEMLKQAEIDYKYRKMRFGRDFMDNNYIIAKESGEPYKPHYFSEKFRSFIMRSNLKVIRLHDMRHTNATLMLSIGISPKVAQQRLGHSNFSTTMDIYSHVLDEVGKDAADKIEDSILTGRKKVIM